MSEPIIEEDPDTGLDEPENNNDDTGEQDTLDESLSPEEEKYLLKLDAFKIRAIQYGLVKTQLLQVLQEIKIAAEQGLSSIELLIDPHPQLQEELLQRDFMLYVYSRTNSNDKFMKISW